MKERLASLVKRQEGGYPLRVLLVVSVVFFLLGVLLEKQLKEQQIKTFITSFKTIRDEDDNYRFISPLIGNISDPATDVGIYTDIRAKLYRYIEKKKNEGELYDISLYFRDLSSSLWFGINEEEAFFPASLFKLPIAIAMYKQAEDSPALLTKRLVYTKELHTFNTQDKDSEVTTLTVGKAYSVEVLVEIMLEKSDNGAKDLLLTVLNKDYLENLLRDVAIPDPLTTPQFGISSRKYAHLLRILYNGSYLTKADSDRLLTLIWKSNFSDGLVAGAPANVLVAHKFGVHDVQEEKNGEQVVALHDCGIVYAPMHPYILCIMSKGRDTTSLLAAISTLSKTIYTYQTSHKHKDK